VTLARLTSGVIAAAITLGVASSPAHAQQQQRTDGARLVDRPSGEERDKEKAEHFRVGPLLGLGFPRPLTIGGLAKIEKLVGVGFEYSFMPRVSVLGVDTGFDAVAVDLRVFPFRGSFFIGARVGRQWLDAKARINAGRFGSVVESMNAETWFVNPRVGFLHTFGSGITLGIDAGIQLPISPSYRREGVATAAGVATELDVDGTLIAVANVLGNNPTPTLDLLRLGFLF
jgi:hypothetical protein